MEKIIDENKQGESLALEQKEDNKRKLFIESYGCAMNFSDSEIVASIMVNQGYNTTQNLEEADLVLVNTCSIRDKAEQTVRKRLEKYNAVKRDHNPKMKVGVLGCMAERLKTKFLEEEKIVDLVVGPDAYKDLPNLLAEVDEGRDAINVILSKDETYGDISPVRLNTNGVTAFVSITRGCDNMCTFCVVPFTRGRERSRDPQSIIEEVNNLWSKGYKDITLLGQNVDSYLWYGGGLKKDFEQASDMQKATSVNFSKLLEICAKTQPKMRVRFSTSNPQDLTMDVVETMAKYQNICSHIHLPVQSGSNKILKLTLDLDETWEFLKNNRYTIDVYLWSGGRAFTGRVRIGSDFGFGFDGDIINQSQIVAIRLDRFDNWSSENTFDRIQFRYQRLNTKTFRIDDIAIVNAIETSVTNIVYRTSEIPVNDGSNSTDSKVYLEADVSSGATGSRPTKQPDGSLVFEVPDSATTEMDDMSNMTASKTTPIDADNLTLWDSVASSFKKLSISNLKTFLTKF